MWPYTEYFKTAEKIYRKNKLVTPNRLIDGLVERFLLELNNRWLRFQIKNIKTRSKYFTKCYVKHVYVRKTCEFFGTVPGTELL